MDMETRKASLPDCVRTKLAGLREAATDADGRHAAAHKEVADLELRIAELENFLDSVVPQTVRARELRATLKRLRADRDRLTATRAKRNAEWQQRRNLFGRVDDWVVVQLRDNPHVTFRAARSPGAVTYTPATLTATRKEIDALNRERTELQQRPRSRASLEREVAGYVQRLAARTRVTPEEARPQITTAGLTIQRATAFTVNVATYDAVNEPDRMVSLLAWLDPQALTARMLASIPKSSEPGIDPAERAAALDALDARLLAVERKEEALIEAAALDGATIERRADADPRAILGIELASSNAAAA